MNKKIIHTDKAPAPIGPYNQATEVNGFVFVSGQIAIQPDTGDLVIEDIEAETRQVMSNIAAVLKESGLDFGNVVKSAIFLSDMNNFSTVNAIYAEYFDEATAPARECVEVSRLPKNVNVEISVIAAK